MTACLKQENDKLILQCDYMFRAAAGSIPCRHWNEETKCWEYPLKPETIRQIKEAFPVLRIVGTLAETVREMEAAEEQTEVNKAKNWADVLPVEPMPIKVKPFRHQVVGYNIGLTIPAAAILFEMGCGKSLTAVAIAGRRFLRGEIQRLLVICPAAVIPVWPREFQDYADFPFQAKPLESNGEKRRKELTEWSRDPNVLQIAIINYEATWRLEEELTQWHPEMIICDESQRIKTPGSKQSRCLHNLSKKTKYRLILTGTPVSNTPLDFFSQYKFLAPTIFGSSFYAFRNKYAILGGFEGRKVIGYRNLGELIKKAHSVAFRVTKRQALDLPETVDQNLYCELEPEAKRTYRQLVKDCVAILSETATLTAPQVITRLLRFSQITGGNLIDDDRQRHRISRAKINLFKDVLGDLMETGKKVVVFCRFVPEMLDLSEVCQEKNIGYTLIYGAVPQEQRGEAVQWFQTDPDCRVFIAQIQTAGLGITLTAADTAIFYSLDFSYANYEQARARIHRIGQKNTCTYIHLLAKGTIDEQIIEALKNKKSIADDVVDNYKKYLGGQ